MDCLEMGIDLALGFLEPLSSLHISVEALSAACSAVWPLSPVRVSLPSHAAGALPPAIFHSILVTLVPHLQPCTDPLLGFPWWLVPLHCINNITR